jgi:hypothetical protein
MTQSAAKYRAAAGWLLLMAMTGYAALDLLIRSVEVYLDLPEKDPVTIHEERINQLCSSLPSRGEIGYITTLESEKIFSEEKAFKNVEHLAQYVLTQYTLAPRIVRNSPRLPLVVGNFLDGPPPSALIEKNRLIPVKDFGDGLILYQGNPEP